MITFSKLPKVLQDLIYEYNVEHRPQMQLVCSELLNKHNNRIIRDETCRNCWGLTDPNYTKYILYKKYTFCSNWCQYDLESTIRKDWRRSLSNLNK